MLTVSVLRSLLHLHAHLHTYTHTHIHTYTHTHIYTCTHTHIHTYTHTHTHTHTNIDTHWQTRTDTLTYNLSHAHYRHQESAATKLAAVNELLDQLEGIRSLNQVLEVQASAMALAKVF